MSLNPEDKLREALEKRGETEAEKPENEAEAEPQTTLFFDPSVYYTDDDNEPKPKKRLSKNIIFSIIGMVVLVLALIAIRLWVPKKTVKETSSQPDLSVAVTEYAANDVETVTVKCKDADTVTFQSVLDETAEESTVKWTIAGVDPSLTNSGTIAASVESVSSLVAIRTMDAITDGEQSSNTSSDKVDYEDYGFTVPYAEVSLTSRNNKFNPYTVIIGNRSPDFSGYYVTTSLSKEVYLVASDTVHAFCKDAREYVNTVVLNAVTADTVPEGYYDEGQNALVYFDALSVTGRYYNDAVLSFAKNPNADTAGVMPYIMTSPVQRDADQNKVQALLAPFSNGITAEGCYSYNATLTELDEYKLRAPEIVLSFTAGSTSHTVKLSSVDTSTYALMVDNCNAIYKVDAEAFSFESQAYGYANTSAFIEPLKNFVSVSVTAEDKTYDFKVSYNESEDAETSFDITAGTKAIKAENFQNYYAQLMSATIIDFTTEQPATPVTMTVIATRADGSQRVVQWRKASDRRYHVTVDGQGMGCISTSVYENLVEYAANAYAGKAVPSSTDR